MEAGGGGVKVIIRHPSPSLLLLSSVKQQQPNKANHHVRDSQRIFCHSPDHHRASFCHTSRRHLPSVADPDLGHRCFATNRYVPLCVRRHRASHPLPHESTTNPFDRRVPGAQLGFDSSSSISRQPFTTLQNTFTARISWTNTRANFTEGYEAHNTPTGKHGYHGSCCS